MDPEEAGHHPTKVPWAMCDQSKVQVVREDYRRPTRTRGKPSQTEALTFDGTHQSNSVELQGTSNETRNFESGGGQGIGGPNLIPTHGIHLKCERSGHLRRPSPYREQGDHVARE